MSKKIILLIVVITLLLVALIIAFKPNKPSKQDLQKIEQSIELNNIIQEQKNNSEITNIEPTKDTIVLKITSPNNVNYKVQKQWFSKDAEEVVGTTTATGQGTVNKNTGEYSVVVNADLANLTTESEGRDREVQKLFTDKIGILKLSGNLSDLGIEKGAELDSKVNAELTINGITKVVELQVTGSYNQTALTAQGKTNFDMPDFNITPPNLINVYKVAPNVTVEFNIQAEVE